MQTKQLHLLDRTQILNQGLANAGAGLIGTTFHYAVMITILQTELVQLVVASTIGAITGGIINYVLAHGQVFRSRVRHRIAAFRFTTVAVVGIGVNALVLALCAPVFGLPAGQITASAVVLLSGFTLNRSWSFRE